VRSVLESVLILDKVNYTYIAEIDFIAETGFKKCKPSKVGGPWGISDIRTEFFSMPFIFGQLTLMCLLRIDLRCVRY